MRVLQLATYHPCERPSGRRDCCLQFEGVPTVIQYSVACQHQPGFPETRDTTNRLADAERSFPPLPATQSIPG